MLPPQDVVRFDHALEALGEGDWTLALAEIEALRRAPLRASQLDLALAAALLLAGNDGEAERLLRNAIQTMGISPSGTTLWNLACAQIRLGDLAGAQRALTQCSETEYRSSRTVFAALDLLERRQKPAPKLEVVVSPKHLADALPSSPDLCRREILARLLRPKKQASKYRPDLSRLPQRDVRIVERALGQTRSLSPDAASRLLAPLVRAYPDIYTLRVHAAAYALLDDSDTAIATGLRLLRDAERLRPLDAVSRMNLAYCCLKRHDFPNVIAALEGGSRALADKYTYWLALAMARAVANVPSASDAAARAIALATAGPGLTEVTAVLAASGIQAKPALPQEDPISNAASGALEQLSRGEAEGAQNTLAQLWGFRPEWIPEIGPTVLEPQFRATTRVVESGHLG